MNRVVSVDKTISATGTKWFVTMEGTNREHVRVEVGEAEARRFQAVLQSQQGGQSRLLTETLP